MRNKRIETMLDVQNKLNFILLLGSGSFTLLYFIRFPLIPDSDSFLYAFVLLLVSDPCD